MPTFFPKQFGHNLPFLTNEVSEDSLGILNSMKVHKGLTDSQIQKYILFKIQDSVESLAPLLYA